MKGALVSKRLWKRLGGVLVSLVLLLLILIMVGGFLLPRDRVRSLLQERLVEATGGQVEVGKPSLLIFPGPGLRIRDLVLEGEGDGGDLLGYHLQLDHLDVHLALKPLLQRRLEVVSISAVGERLELEWATEHLVARGLGLSVSDLVLNLDQTAGEPTTPATAPPGERLPEDLGFRFALRVGDMALASTTYQDLVLHGELDTRLLTLESLVARQGEGVLTGDGEVDFERDPWGELEFELVAEDVPAQHLLAPYAPDLAGRLQGDLDGRAAGTCNLKDGETVSRTLSITGELSGQEGELAAADWLRDAIPYLGERRDLVNVRFDRLKHLFRVQEGRYILDELTLEGGETDWQGEGWIEFDGPMDAQLRVKLPPGFTPELGKWRFLAETLRDDEGRVNLAFRLRGPSGNPRVGLDLGGLR